MSKRSQLKRNKALAAKRLNQLTFRESSAPLSVSHGAPIPFFRTMPASNGGDMCVSGLEYIGTLSSLLAGTVVTGYALNARNATTFPRLSAIADVFLKHRFHKLVFHMVGRSASTIAGTHCGGAFLNEVSTATTAPTTDAQVKRLEGAQSASYWMRSRVVIPVKEASFKWYVNDGTTAAFGDAMGSFYTSLTATAADGDGKVDVYVEYTSDFAGMVDGAQIALSQDEMDLVRFVRKLGKDEMKAFFTKVLGEKKVVQEVSSTQGQETGTTYLVRFRH